MSRTEITTLVIGAGLCGAALVWLTRAFAVGEEKGEDALLVGPLTQGSSLHDFIPKTVRRPKVVVSRKLVPFFPLRLGCVPNAFAFFPFFLDSCSGHSCFKESFKVGQNQHGNPFSLSFPFSNILIQTAKKRAYHLRYKPACFPFYFASS